MDRIMKITGRGKLSVKPDRIRLFMTLEGMMPEYGDAIEDSARQTEVLRSEFEKMGFDRTDIKTLSFGVNASYSSYEDEDGIRRRHFDGYEYTHRMKTEFEADNALLGKVLRYIAGCSADPEISIEHTVADPEKYRNELLKNAVKDSKTKAEVLAEATGVRLGDIADIDYSWGTVEFKSMPLNINYDCISDCGPGFSDFDIEADDIDVTDTVTVVWNIL